MTSSCAVRNSPFNAREPEIGKPPADASIAPRQDVHSSLESTSGNFRNSRAGAELLPECGVADVPGYAQGSDVNPALLAGNSANVYCREGIFEALPYLTCFAEEDEAIENGSGGPDIHTNSFREQSVVGPSVGR